MSSGKDTQEPSMEEILSSIRRIIADEQDEPASSRGGSSTPARRDPSGREPIGGAPGLPGVAPQPAREPTPAPTGATHAASAPPAARSPAGPLASSAPPASDDDEIELTERVRGPMGPPQPARAGEPAPVPPRREETVQMIGQNDETRFVSSTAATASTNALARLTRAVAPEERPSSPESSRTIEQLVIELLRPQLTEWLDQHLPAIVERVVEQEVKRLARRAELL